MPQQQSNPATNRLWLLGPQSSEMAAIESLLQQLGEPVVYAADANGQRVLAGRGNYAVRYINPDAKSAGGSLLCPAVTLTHGVDVFPLRNNQLSRSLVWIAPQAESKGFARAMLGQTLVHLARAMVLTAKRLPWQRTMCSDLATPAGNFAVCGGDLAVCQLATWWHIPKRWVDLAS